MKKIRGFSWAALFLPVPLMQTKTVTMEDSEAERRNADFVDFDKLGAVLSVTEAQVKNTPQMPFLVTFCGYGQKVTKELIQSIKVPYRKPTSEIA